MASSPGTSVSAGAASGPSVPSSMTIAYTKLNLIPGYCF